MVKKVDIWGHCPLRHVGWANFGKKVGSWCYICGKNGSPCDPNYCLGPDEEQKGDENERKIS